MNTSNFQAGLPQNAVLLDGFSRVLHFLLNAEVDYICAVPAKSRSAARLNYRSGHRRRTLRTPAGAFDVRVPVLKSLYPRVSMMKRAKRLAGVVIERLAGIHSGGVTGDDVSALIKALWTMELSEERLGGLSDKLMVILEDWHCGKREALTGLEIWRVAGAQGGETAVVAVSPESTGDKAVCAAEQAEGAQAEGALVIPNENCPKS